MARLAALTGATGFLGRHLVRELAAQGWQVRILARRDPIDPLWRELEPEVVPGGLSDTTALARLCRGADVVVHNAGVVKVGRLSEFHAVNVAGAAALAEAAAEAAHVVLVSSLTARHPELSPYAASKRAGEEAARARLGERLSIVRPPAIYGPYDRELLPLFRAAEASPLLPVFAGHARTALIHVEDAARQIAAVAAGPPLARVASLSDARPEGYSWREIMAAVAAAVGGRPGLAPTPAALVHGLAMANVLGRIVGGAPILTPGKARELLHPDWALTAEERAFGLPEARFGLADGLAQTAAWYREVGWMGYRK